MSKLILCLDFDGVIHSYTSGWKGATAIPDPVVKGTFDFLVEAIKEFDVQIYSSRSNQDGGIDAMHAYLFSRYCEWLDSHPHADDQPAPLTFIEEIKFPLHKPPAFIGIDDRVITFQGIWPSVETLKDFKPWNKKGEKDGNA